MVVLQTRDPFCVHTYWEVQPATLNRVRERLGAGGLTPQFVLRVYEEESSRWFDVQVAPEALDWAVEVQPDRAWTVEIGLLSSAGRFLALARSNTVRTPPDRPSDRVDEKWGVLKEPLVSPRFGDGSSRSGWGR